MSRLQIDSNSEKNPIMYVDAGRDHSQIVLVDMYMDMGRNLTVKGVRSTIREQAKSIVEMILSYRPSKLIIDTVGIGLALFDIIIEESRGKVRISENGSLTYMDKII
ncbi:hypothetical protein AB0R69_15365 [Bacillus pumilus]|uniref:hypothetical protein n=1 Tax=Bacillus pumilus TaxID=1408 RepID=UPI00345259C2